MADEPSWDDIFKDHSSTGARRTIDPTAPPRSRRALREQPAQPEPRQRREKRGHEGDPRPKRRWAGFVAFLVIVGLFGGAATYGWLNYEPQIRELFGWELPNDYEGSGNGEEVVVVIESGHIGSDVAQTLVDEGVTLSYEAFYDLLLVTEPAPEFQPGNYALQKEMSAQAALDRLQDPASRVTSSVTIPEGTTANGTFELLSAASGIPVEEFTTVAGDHASFGVPADAPNIDGWLFPATYELDPSLDARALIQMLVDTMKQRLDELGVPEGDRQRVLTFAAIVQREAGPNPDDLGKIARVFQNRLDAGWNLESDATVAYGTGNFSSVFTTDAERADASNPYNTYANPGLPVGPIGNPGVAAIQAALAPAEGPWFFFVTVDLRDGTTVFSATIEEHEAGVARLQAWCADEANAEFCG